MIPTAVRFASTYTVVRFSNKIRPIAEKLNLGLPTEAKHLKCQNRAEFPVSIAISEKHLVKQQHMKWLAEPEQSLTIKYLSFYTAKPLQPLLIWAYSLPRKGSAAVVVKNRSTTRIRRAFCVALNMNGYNWIGRGISKELNTQGKQIYGTVVLGGEEPQRILLLEFPRLVNYFAQQIKDTIAPQLSRNVSGESAESLPPTEDDSLEPGILDADRNV